MVIYGRIVFFLDKPHVFMNLTTEPTILFQEGLRLCTGKINSSGPREKIIIEYGPFDERAEAEKLCKNLVRRIKLMLAKTEVAFAISPNNSVYDDKNIPVLEERKLPVLQKYIDKRIAQEVTGMSLYEVDQNLSEISFLSGSADLELGSSFRLADNAPLKWSDNQDIAISLLCSSSRVFDYSVKFLLRCMALEALVADTQARSDEDIEAIDLAIEHIKHIDSLNADQKSLIISQISRAKEKSVRNKIVELLQKRLPGKTYAEKTPKAFFDECYSARSQFTHAGHRTKINEHMSTELKKMVVDLLISYTE